MKPETAGEVRRDYDDSRNGDPSDPRVGHFRSPPRASGDYAAFAIADGAATLWALW